MTNNKALAQARALSLPSRQAALQREASVSLFWKNNRELLEDAWAAWEFENKDSLLIPDESLLDPRLRKAVNEAWENPEKEQAVANLWEEIIPGVYVAQFFDIDRLADFRKYLEAIANSQIPKRAPYGIEPLRNYAGPTFRRTSCSSKFPGILQCINGSVYASHIPIIIGHLWLR